jgi:hypothetical protein
MMRFTTSLAFAALATAFPSRLSRRDVTDIPNTERFDILLAGNVNGRVEQISQSVTVMIVDMENTNAETIAQIKEAGKKPICYFSAGSYEDGRSDSGKFKSKDKGNHMDGWPEYWLDVKSENVRNIMVERIKKAAEKGCAGVDPDNTDGYVS